MKDRKEGEVVKRKNPSIFSPPLLSIGKIYQRQERWSKYFQNTATKKIINNNRFFIDTDSRQKRTSSIKKKKKSVQEEKILKFSKYNRQNWPRPSSMKRHRPPVHYRKY